MVLLKFLLFEVFKVVVMCFYDSIFWWNTSIINEFYRNIVWGMFIGIIADLLGVYC